VTLVVTLVGKTLVHYRRYKTKLQGVNNTMTSKLYFEKYLIDNNAVLLSK